MAKTILIVDDSSSLRVVVSIALKSAGYDVIEACDGKDALTKLNGQKIHMIISDVNMPNMDGISLVKAIKQLVFQLLILLNKIQLQLLLLWLLY